LADALDGVFVDPPADAYPAWLRDVCDRREHFEGSAFVVTVDDERVFWKFNFAMQSLMFLSVSRLVQLDNYFPGGSSVDSEARRIQWHSWLFQIDYGRNDSCPFLNKAVADIHVVPNLELTHESRNELFSDCRLLSLSAFLARAPPAQPRVQKDDTDKAKSACKPSWTDKIGAKGRPSKAVVDIGSDSSSDDDAVADDAYWELERLRQGLIDSDAARSHDFRVVVEKRVALIATHGTAAAAVQGSARSDDVRAWCRSQGVSATFNCNLPAYDADEAGILARGWCSKMQFCFNIALATTGKYAFSADELASWIELAEFTTLASYCTLPLTKNRVAQIRRLLS
jgi:hypothetical protein